VGRQNNEDHSIRRGGGAPAVVHKKKCHKREANGKPGGISKDPGSQKRGKAAPSRLRDQQEDQHRKRKKKSSKRKNLKKKLKKKRNTVFRLDQEGLKSEGTRASLAPVNPSRLLKNALTPTGRMSTGKLERGWGDAGLVRSGMQREREL